MKKTLEEKFTTLKDRQVLKQKIYDLIVSEIPFATTKFAITLLEETKQTFIDEALNREILAYKSIEQEEEGFNYE